MVRGSTSVRWLILGLLFVVSFVSYLLRTNISVAAKFMMPDLGLTEIQMGWVFGSFTLAYAAFQFPGGIFGEWLGGRRSIALITLLWGVLTVLTGLLPGLFFTTSAAALIMLLVVRFAMGVAQAPIYPVMAGMVERWFPPSGWALPNGLGSTGLTLGAAAASPFVAWLMVTLGWRESFYAAAPVAFLTIAAWWWYARDDPAEHSSVNEAALALIAAGRPAPGGSESNRGAWRQLLKNRETLLLALSYLCMNYVFYIFFAWFYIYLVDVREFSLLAGGFYGALPWLVGSVGATLGGALCDRLCKKIGPRWGCRLPCVASLLLVAAFLFAGVTTENPYLAVAYLSICFGFTQMTEGAYWSGATFVAGPHTSAATGILNTGGNLGGVISTPLIPILVDWFGWLPALATGSAFALVGALLWIWIEVDRPLAGAEAPPAANPARP
jgi:ACS family glucarate transporter-like MFS transporter